MIIVLGATGTIGQLLVKQLEQLSQDYVVVARTPKKAQKILPDQKIRFGDLDKPESLNSAFKGGTSLFLLSGHGEGMEKQQLTAIDAAKKCGIKRIVKISGCEASIDAHSSSETGREHWRIEQHLKQSSDDYVILRCNFFMQNLLDQAASMVKSKNKIMMPFDKNTGFSFIDAQDIAACAAQALIEPKYAAKTFYLTGEQSSFLELTRLLSLNLSVSVSYKKVPLWLSKIVMRLKGNSARMVRHQLEMAKLFMGGAGEKSTSSVNDILGRSPQTLNEFIKRSIGNFQ